MAKHKKSEVEEENWLRHEPLREKRKAKDTLFKSKRSIGKEWDDDKRRGRAGEEKEEKCERQRAVEAESQPFGEKNDSPAGAGRTITVTQFCETAWLAYLVSNR